MNNNISKQPKELLDEEIVSGAEQAIRLVGTHFGCNTQQTETMLHQQIASTRQVYWEDLTREQQIEIENALIEEQSYLSEVA